MERDITMERKTLMRTILLVLAGAVIFLSGCKKENKDTNTRVIRSMIISGYTPKIPTSRDNITLSVIKRMPDMSFHWILNGKQINTNSPTLRHGLYKRGDSLFCYIYSGKNLVTKVGPIIIADTPPTITNVFITPFSPIKGTDLHIAIKSSDADNDVISYFIKWYKNGTVVSTDSILPGNMIKGGDRIFALVTPFDGYVKGPSVKTPVITVKNSAPVITSTPPRHLTDKQLVYKVVAEDPDGDPVTFSLVSHPKEAVINGETGLLQYTVSSSSPKEINFIVKASDNHGNYSLQTFSYTIK